MTIAANYQSTENTYYVSEPASGPVFLIAPAPDHVVQLALLAIEGFKAFQEQMRAHHEQQMDELSQAFSTLNLGQEPNTPPAAPLPTNPTKFDF